MKAWSKDLDSSKVSGIRFLADPAGEFTRAWDVEFDATPLLGNKRSKRYAVVTEDGKVSKVAIEPDPTQVTGEVSRTQTQVSCLTRGQSLEPRASCKQPHPALGT
jgi:2-Cys peroxiredoxin 5